MTQLHVIEASTGEILEGCESCAEYQSIIAGHEHTIRSQSSVIAKLQRDKEREARAHDRWDEAKAIFSHWQKATGRTKTRFSADRFWLVLPFLEKDGPDLCRKAIDGRAYDHYTDRRKNGTLIRYHEFERVFGSRGAFEESCNRAPLEEAA